MTNTESLLQYGLVKHAQLSIRLDTLPAHSLGDLPGTMVRCANTLVAVSNQIGRSTKKTTMPESDLRRLLARCIELLTFVDVRMDRLEAGKVGDQLYDDFSL